MKNRTHLYVSPKHPLTVMMAVCMAASAVARIGILGVNGTADLWSQILLPMAASTLYALICLLDGKEHFYRTAIPVWLMAIYSGLWLRDNLSSQLLVLLFWVALVFFASSYTDITSGHRGHTILFLLPLVLAPLGFMAYYCREALLYMDHQTLLIFLPDMLALLGAAFQVMAVWIHPIGEYHPTWGDRSDGRRVRTLPPMAQVSPYLMVNRNESTNLFSDAFEISHVDRYIRAKRREGMTNFGIMHVFLACYCRCLCRYPALNRFLSGQRIYSRGEDVQFCLTVKKEMTSTSPDTVIKVHLSPRDTAADVYRKVQAEVEKVKNSPLDSSFDNTAGILNLIPGVVLKFLVWLLKLLDYFGLIPSFLLEVSPFHGSLFLTSMGSLGIPPIYHHLYDFGNLPVFGAFGMKRRAVDVLEDGTLVQRKYVDVKFTTDERIVDGFYYAAFFKHYKRLLQHPEVLDKVPEEVLCDID